MFLDSFLELLTQLGTLFRSFIDNFRLVKTGFLAEDEVNDEDKFAEAVEQYEYFIGENPFDTGKHHSCHMTPFYFCTKSG